MPKDIIITKRQEEQRFSGFEHTHLGEKAFEMFRYDQLGLLISSVKIK